MAVRQPSTVNFEPLYEGPLPNDRAREDGVVVHSLTAHAVCSMDRHKWIESEKRGYDAGEAAYREWVDRHWRSFVRSKLLEHLYGMRCWSGFDEADYGLLSRSSVQYHIPQDQLETISGILADGGENLDVINWALAHNHALDPVLWLLERIDINAKRHRLLTDHIRLFVERT
jgi:hypothetical protein